MATQFVSIIQFTRESQAGDVAYKSVELASDDVVEELLARYKTLFASRSQKKFGRFDPEAESSLPAAFEGLKSGDVSPSELVSRVSQHMAQQLAKLEQPIDGIWLLTQETGEQDTCYGFWLTTEASIAFNELTPVKQQQINMSLLPVAIKINLSDWQGEGEARYFSVLENRAHAEIALAVKTALVFIEGVDKKALTDQFLQAVEAFSQELPKEEAYESKTKLVNYCIEQDKQGELIELDEVAEVSFEKAPSKFKQFIEQNQPDLPKALPADRAKLQKYLRFSGRDKDLSIAFGSQSLGERVHYDETTDTLKIVGLPKSLKQQLLKKLQDN
ncbi:nucleoid-associated protein [Salinibius halmophilus]|uniref:nucleoid-associated protein n=1 Tax=Salinibius halmophilus TaxID=1853216 RepID=UPI000E66B889|nr:nucleoid-associated protein [Salinibius halmophilus]